MGKYFRIHKGLHVHSCFLEEKAVLFPRNFQKSGFIEIPRKYGSFSAKYRERGTCIGTP
jgi:hypothetical protein